MIQTGITKPHQVTIQDNLTHALLWSLNFLRIGSIAKTMYGSSLVGKIVTGTNFAIGLVMTVAVNSTANYEENNL